MWGSQCRVKIKNTPCLPFWSFLLDLSSSKITLLNGSSVSSNSNYLPAVILGAVNTDKASFIKLSF